MEGILPSPAEAETEEEMFTMPTIDMVATGRNIMRLREAAGLNVRDLQDIFGFATPQAIYKWQHGTAMPTIDNLVVLAAVLDVPMDEIIVIDVNRTKQITTQYISFESKKLYTVIGQEWSEFYLKATANILSLLDTVRV